MDTISFDSPEAGLLSRGRIIAQPGFNRWLVPPAALAIHLCIGMAYGFSVFWLPLSRAVGIKRPIACAAGSSLADRLVTTSCDWQVSDLTIMYTLFFVVLGSAAAIWGGWLERAGPRKAGVVSASCWCGGMVVSAAGIYLHQLWMMWLGSGVIGGVGLGLGYISPVSTLINWFPDRRGMATGMAIMGFGGGALVGAPLANALMNSFATDASVGVWPTFLVMAAIYAVFMLGGAFGYRVPPAGWSPDGWAPPARRGMITSGNVPLRDAHRTAQFWLIWLVLLLNVTATIGIIGVASPMLQEVFGGRLAGHPELGFAAVQADTGLKTEAAAIAAGFVGLLSLFNIGGRFVWASLSDRLGRRATYLVFFVLGGVLYAVLPGAASAGSLVLFTLAFAVIASMYGGGFASVPAYLADVFGTKYVGAIHGRLLTAWSVAGIFGPRLIANFYDASAGVHAYDTVFTVLAGVLAAGFVCNLLVRPLAARWFMSEAGTAGPQLAGSRACGSSGIGRGGFTPAAGLAWAAVGLPLAWGVYITLDKARVLLG